MNIINDTSYQNGVVFISLQCTEMSVKPANSLFNENGSLSYLPWFVVFFHRNKNNCGRRSMTVE